MQRGAACASALAVTILAAACGSTTPAAVRHAATTTSAPPTTTTTTTLPSAVPTTVPTPVVAAVGWSAPLTTLPPVGGFTSVSCISDVFCLAAGGGSEEADAADSSGPGVVGSWDGATWATPVTYFPSPAGDNPPPWLPAISCTDGPLCWVTDGSGHTSEGNGTTWSSPTPLAGVPVAPPDPSDPGPGHAGARSAAVSCPTSAFCAYVDNTGHVAIWSGTAWSTPRAFTAPVGGSTVELYQSGRVGVSCPDPSDCTALVGDAVLDWDGSTWTSSAGPWGSSVTGDSAVSCPSAGICVAVRGTSVSVRSPGSGWSSPRAIDGNGHLDSVSCRTLANCTAVDAYGDVVQFTGGSWSPPHKVVPTPVGYAGDGVTVSCPSAQFCMVLTGDGDYATYQGASVASPTGATTAGPTAP